MPFDKTLKKAGNHVGTLNDARDAAKGDSWAWLKLGVEAAARFGIRGMNWLTLYFTGVEIFVDTKEKVGPIIDQSLIDHPGQGIPKTYTIPGVRKGANGEWINYNQPNNY